MGKLHDKMEQDLKLRGLCENTRETYLRCARTFVKHYRKSPTEMGKSEVRDARWLEHRALERGFATALVQISETDTPLYKMETVYRRAVEGLQTREWSDGAFRNLIERWFYNLEDEVLTQPGTDAHKPESVAKVVGELLEQRLAAVSATQPQFAAALRACHGARVTGDHAVEQGLVAWLMGQPNVGAAIKRAAALKGEIDSGGALGFLRGLLEVIKQTGRKGLVLVLDEVEPGRARAVTGVVALPHWPKLTRASAQIRPYISSGTPKFQPCLPEELLRDLLVHSVLDVEGARRVVGRWSPDAIRRAARMGVGEA